MPRYINPTPQIIDKNGIPIVGAGKFLYESGATVLKTIYSDSALTVPISNPVLSGSDGRFPSIFLDGIYREIQRETSSALSTVLWDRDPLGGAVEGQFSLWVSSNIYNIPDIVVGSNDDEYRSITDANQGNNPTTSPANWEQLKLGRVWNLNITYAIDDIVIKGSEEYTAITANINKDPELNPSDWRKDIKIWTAIKVYDTDDIVYYNGQLYTSVVNANSNNTPVPGIDDAFWHNTTRFPPFNNIRAYRSISDQLNIPVSFTILQLNSTSFDTNNDFDETLFRLTPTVAGRYRMNVSINWTGLAANDALDIAIRKNGSTVSSVRKIAVSTSFASFEIADTQEANGTTDYFEVFVRNLASSTSDIFFGVADTYWAIEWVGGL